MSLGIHTKTLSATLTRDGKGGAFSVNDYEAGGFGIGERWWPEIQTTVGAALIGGMGQGVSWWEA